MKFYPEAIKYYFRIQAEGLDDKDRITFGLFFEVMFFQYIERNRKKGAST